MNVDGVSVADMIFIPCKDTDQIFIERYTRKSFKQKENLNKFEKDHLNELEQCLNDKNYQYTFRTFFGKDIVLSHEDSLKVLHCAICDKDWSNNGPSYCEGCPNVNKIFHKRLVRA